MSLLHDERGSWSSARCSFWITLVWTMILVSLEAGGLIEPLSSGAYGILGTLFMATAAWAAGPRGLQYLGPQVGKVVSALSQRLKGTDDRYRDDER